jgi:protein-histidine pros-kinase
VRPVAQEDKFQAMLDAAPDAMIGVNAHGTILMANIQTGKLFGYTRADLIGQPVEILVPDRAKDVHPSHRGRYFVEPNTRPMGAGLELAGRRADGTEFPAEISLSSIETEDGTLALAAIRDISDRKKTEEAMRRAREEADRANKAKSDFLSRMSHELRTPLNSILGFGQILEVEASTEAQSTAVERILAGGQHLLELINEVLEIARIESGRIARIESGRLSLSVEAVHVGRLLDESLELVRPLAEKAGVRLAQPNKVDVQVRADRQRMKQVFLNLFTNAIKFNHENGEVSIEATHQTDDRLRISISDTGRGIPEEYMSELFVPFARSGADQFGVEGTGLGLTLAKGLVESMGGTIGVSSTAGKGSTFWVELPVATQQGTGVLAPEKPEWARGGSNKPRTVLYIEDNLANLQLIERIFGYRPAIKLLSAMQGGLGIELAQEHQPDLILLDLHLPDMSGEDVLLLLRGIDSTRDIPTIVLTADASQGTARKLTAAGASHFVTKPVNVASFLATVDEMLA